MLVSFCFLLCGLVLVFGFMLLVLFVFLKGVKGCVVAGKMVRPRKSTQEPRDDTSRDDSIAIRQMTEFMQQNFRPQQAGPWPQQGGPWPQ